MPLETEAARLLLSRLHVQRGHRRSSGVGPAVFGFSHNRFNLFSIDDRDHVDLGQPGGIRGNLTEWLAGQGISCPGDARIQLLTFPRVLGYGFNPVSFYYIESNAGDPLAAVAEVVNTFREMKLYAMDSLPETGSGIAGWRRISMSRLFRSRLRSLTFPLGLPGNHWRVNIDDYAGGERMLLSAMRGERRKLTSSRVFWYALKYPMLSLKIIGLIHWHAFLLWIGGAVFPKIRAS